MSEYLEFKEIPFKGKTKKFHVVSKSCCVPLAIIKWYPQWRQYTFFPYGETIWNKDCMNDIISFINNLMRDRQIKMGTYKGYVSEEDYRRLKNV